MPPQNEKGNPTSGVNEFYWSDEPEPHLDRKKQLLKKYGKQISPLMGIEPLTKYLGLIPICIQIAMAYYCSTLSWGPFLLLAYVVGGTANHSLFLLIHEVTHGLAFKTQLFTDAYSIFANLPIAVPYAMMFKFYHYEHHRYQGWDGIDTDIPSNIEAVLFTNTFGKLLFCIFQIFFYALRPTFLRSPQVHPSAIANWIAVVSFNYAVWTYWGPSALLYLLLSSLFSGMLHPMSGHFIGEHYMGIFHPGKTQETFSYYGPLNVFGWNVGLHNEHHDFPNVPWTRLWELRKIAPEFYEPLIKCESWPGTVYRFITDSRVSLWCRMKRERDAGRRRGPLLSTNEGASPVTPSPAASQ